ncbi:50S ribosomal protein L19e [uncultured archaeon]|nr:50S ribosomal protein L19e [uncultured archaeon]
MAMNTVRRIASEVLGVGESKVRFKPDAASKIGEALTREDVRGLIKDGSIYAIEPRGVSRLRGREKHSQMRKGRRFGKGSRKGTYGTRVGQKDTWVAKVRAQRKYLRMLVEKKQIQQGAVRKIYRMVKGNAFKGVKVMDIYLRDNKFLIEKK